MKQNLKISEVSPTQMDIINSVWACTIFWRKKGSKFEVKAANRKSERLIEDIIDKIE